MAKLDLTYAASDYDHTRDLVSGKVRVEGIELNCLDLSIEETFFRFTKFREWDVSEMSMGKYVALVSQNDPGVTAIPVFPSRVFRQSSVYIRRDGPIKRAEDLRGKRVGLPEWAQTAAVYSRGWLMHDIGIPLAEIKWVQAGVNQPGRVEKVELKLPPGVAIDRRPDRSLNDMLLKGDIDAALSAHAPEAFEHGHPDIVRLYPNYRPVEEAYYKATGIFPIMHVIALKKPVFERHRWIAMNLFRAFEAAKANSLARAQEYTASRFPFAWHFEAAERAKAMFGEDFLPYGVEPNRRTLEAFTQYAQEQGVAMRKVAVEELFPAEVLSTFKV
jgi:4,5-dihydroxyphthalate decarboxylase